MLASARLKWLLCAQVSTFHNHTLFAYCIISHNIEQDTLF